MWPADVSNRPDEEAAENDGLLYSQDDVDGDGDWAAGERWQRDVSGNVKNLFESGYYGSSAAEREAHPSYTKFETQGFKGLDWREASIVSSF